MKSVITYTAPNLRPLPTTITDEAIRNATLPVKIEAARRAIAVCTDLAELLRYNDQAQALAAAVKVMKHVAPEMVRNANEMVADAWRKGGELLSQYSNFSKGNGTKGGKKGGTKPSPRGVIGRELGLEPREVSHMVRTYKAPKQTVYKAVQRYSTLSGVAKQLPAVHPEHYSGPRAYSDNLRHIMGTNGTMGLTLAFSSLKRIEMDTFRRLTVDERKLVKSKITEILEMLDEMDCLCR